MAENYPHDARNFISIAPPKSSSVSLNCVVAVAAQTATHYHRHPDLGHMAASQEERYIHRPRCRYWQWYCPRSEGIAQVEKSMFAAVDRLGMDLVEMQAGMVAVYVGSEGVPEHLGQSGCDAARIDAVGFAVVAQCASAAVEAEMA
jgi:hypothetical protein